jgi:DNA-binding FadR family transcriptional regulator
MPLQAVESQRLYRQIADQVRGLIAQGEFPTGSRLPAERDLARQLGVSRPSVREALIALEVEGRVEVRGGSGVYVRARQEAANGSAAVPAGEWGPLELLRARRVVEGEIASLAALEGKRRQVDAIGDAITSMHRDADAGMQPYAGDRAFHVAVAEAAGNVVLLETVQTYWDARRGPLFERLGDHFESVPSWRKAIAEHELVYDAIRARDGAAARDAMRHHLDKAHARFSASWRRANAS